MLKNYLKIALRNLARHKGHAFINVFGLAVGLAAAILLGLFVEHERSYDRFHDRANRVFAVAEKASSAEGVQTHRLTRTPVLPTLLAEVPDVVSGTRVIRWGMPSMGYGERRVELSFTVVDSTFFEVFSFPVLRGDARAALTRPDAVALTASAARRLFGDEDPIGKTLDVHFGQGTAAVLAVVADPPANSSIQFEMLGGWPHIEDIFSLDGIGNWYNTHTPTYVLLREGADAYALKAKLRDFAARHFTPPPGTDVVLLLKPLTSIHVEEAGNGPLLTLLSIIAAAILLIACINFTNLATARTLRRAREVGMRKVLGARREQLIGQFLGESLLTCALALVLGVLLARLVLPFFNRLFDLPLALDYLRHGPALLALGIVVGLAAGLYPAFYLSNLRPVRSLKGQLAHSAGGQRLRQGLVVTQFVLSTALIIGTVVIWQQIQFMKAEDLRFDRENVIVTEVSAAPLGSREQANARLTTTREALLADPAVRAVSFSEVVPGRYAYNFNTYFPEGQDDGAGIRLRQTKVDAHYFETYGISFTAGGGFSRAAPGENEGRAVINQTAAELLGGSAVGQRLRPGGSGNTIFEIAGVTEDFHYQSFEHAIEPLIHTYGGEEPAGYRYLSIRLHPGAAARGVALLRDQWEALYPALDFKYFFTDDAFDALYRAQERIGILAGTFAGLAILIACLGLLSLISFSTQERTKEVGIRKALGATVSQIVVLLSKDFLKLVLVASVIAAPIAHLIMQRWLEDFAYRIDVGVGVFILAGALAFAIALATTGYQALKAARANPVESLRYE